MTDTTEVVKAIILEQSQIIGDYLAIHMAQNSGVVKFKSKRLQDLEVTNPDQQFVFDSLIKSYSTLFGNASVEVCQNVIKKYSTSSQMSI